MTVRNWLCGALLVALLPAGLAAPPTARADSAPPAAPAVRAGGVYDDAAAYVSALYRDLLGRPADPGGLAHWCTALATGRLGAQDIAAALTSSDEWLDRRVTEAYRAALHRDPDPAGAALWRTALRGGLPEASMAAAVQASGEGYAVAGGTDPAWVAALYTGLLGRVADAPGRDAWSALVVTEGREPVALALYQSEESLRRRVQVLYDDLLGRPADPGAVLHWPAVLRDSGDAGLAGCLVSSPEYLARARAQAVRLPPTEVPFGRTLFGASLPYTPGESRADTVTRSRARFGALPVVRIYGDLPSGTWAEDGVVAALGTGSAVIYSVAVPSMAAAAAGAYDAQVGTFLASRPAGLPVWFVLHHEPEDDVRRGAFTAGQFRDATERLAPVARAAGAVPTTVLTAESAFGERWRDFYTPAVDVLAWDAYNSYPRLPSADYRDPGRFVEPVLAVARQTGRAFGWAEFGGACLPSDPGCTGRAAWLTSIGAAFAGSGAQFASYWNRTSVDGSVAYGLDDEASAAAWRALILG